MSLVGEWRIWGGQACFAARLTSRTRSEYDFLLGWRCSGAAIVRCGATFR
jgi:hypothetical protein